MDKSLKYLLLFFVIFLTDCNNKGTLLSKDHNIVITFSPWLSFDYNTKVLTLMFREHDVLRETIVFSKKERADIEEAFLKKQIANLKGEYILNEYVTFPPAEIKFTIFRYKKPLATFHWNPTIEKTANNDEQRIIDFCKTLVNIICEKDEFNYITDESMKRQEKYKEYLF